ncbi:MAG: biotin--[acetyl-CoA-carboxylase] ligase [Gammaproteobacteria bacterium]
MTSRFNKQRIVQLLEDGEFPGGVHLFDTIDSTNDWSLAEIKRGRVPPFICLADHQSRGRGRRGRHWLSPSGANVYLSLVWHFELAAQQLGLLSLAQGVAVIRALRRIGITDAWLKWPNDVLIKSDKIAGVLIETSGIGSGSFNAVIGIGLNYRMPEKLASESIVRWTDVVHAISGGVPDRNVVVAMLLTEVVKMCRLYQHRASSLFDELRRELAALSGRNVSVYTEAGDRVSGQVLGISQTGELRVLVEGSERRFNSADVSLAGPVGGSDEGAGHADD